MNAVARVALAPLDLRRSMALQACGAFDPTASLSELRFDKTFHGPTEVVRVRIAHAPSGLGLAEQASAGVEIAQGSTLRVEVEGVDGAELLARWLPSIASPPDGLASFAPTSALVRRLHHAMPGLRLLRVPWLYDLACSCVLQQRVTYEDATRGWRKLVDAHGHDSVHGRAFPRAEKLARLPLHEIERLGIDAQRSRALIALAREEVMHHFLDLGTSYAALRARLLAIRGIGPWTTEMILAYGAADPDAVPTGDLHLPHLVSWALAREPRGSDARMLELLEPFRGHRGRVCRLLHNGKIAVPRAGRR